MMPDFSHRLHRSETVFVAPLTLRSEALGGLVGRDPEPFDRGRFRRPRRWDRVAGEAAASIWG